MPAPVRTRLDNVTILVVDDEPEVCETVSLILDRRRTVRTATSATQHCHDLASDRPRAAGGPLDAGGRRLHPDAAGARDGRDDSRGGPYRGADRGPGRGAGFPLFLEKPIAVDELTEKLAGLASQGPVASDLVSPAFHLLCREIAPGESDNGGQAWIDGRCVCVVPAGDGCGLRRTPAAGCSLGRPPKQSDRPLAGNGRREPGFQAIFDGKTLTGWEGNPTYWHVENGTWSERSRPTPSSRAIPSSSGAAAKISTSS